MRVSRQRRRKEVRAKRGRDARDPEASAWRAAQIRGLGRFLGRERAIAPSSGVQERGTFQGGVVQ